MRQWGNEMGQWGNSLTIDEMPQCNDQSPITNEQ